MHYSCFMYHINNNNYSSATVMHRLRCKLNMTLILFPRKVNIPIPSTYLICHFLN